MLSNLKKITAVVSAAVMMIVGVAAFTPTVAASVSQDVKYELLIKELSVLVNEAREEAGLEPLYLTPIVSTFAEKRAVELSDYFSHVRPDGSSYKTAITAAGVESNYTGENVATGYTTAKQVVQGWLGSKGHRANILNENFTQIGVGLEKNTGNRYGGYAWTQLFAR